MNTDSPRVVLRSGSLYFGAWPPSLRERPWRGVHLHGRVRSRGSNGLFSHVECGTHGTHGCSQIFVAAFAERFRKRATGPYPVFSVKLKRKGKSGWYQSSTVWLCQVGARAPLTRRPFRSPSGPNFVETWVKSREDCPPYPRALCCNGQQQCALPAKFEFKVASSSALASCWQWDCG